MTSGARRFYRDWAGIAHDAVGSLRIEAARTPANTDLADLIDELATHSAEFAGRWDAHDVEYYRSGRQRFHQPDVGDLDLDYDALEVPADPGLTILTCTLAPAHPTPPPSPGSKNTPIRYDSGPADDGRRVHTEPR
ncbi:hypothetical protein [Nonomuraea sp. NPDC049158]|uniref:MmyB family transcriptional regulator n=1 Tax=Nonomuraea sp. NPDC049158 TaxID=3155649 RepID=UPI003404FCDA